MCDELFPKLLMPRNGGLKNADLHGFRPFGSGSVPKKEDLIQSIMARWWFQLFLFNLYPETGGR